MAKGVLDSVRVIDFGWVWSGPYCSALLADMGAEVIKVESMVRLDSARYTPRCYDGRPGLNRDASFNQINRNKKSCTINLSHPKGVELVKKLISISDVVVENYTARVMTRLGLDYPTLSKLKPDIIMVSLPGFGSTGPEKDCVSYAHILEATTGLVSLVGYPDSRPMEIGVHLPDPIGAITGVVGVLTALYHHKQTGEGKHIDIAQQEAMIALLPEAIMEYTMNGRIKPRMGNRDDFMAPHGCYPCKGEDKWVTIAISSDEEWQALCSAMGNPSWTENEKFSDQYNRWRNQDELDRLISNWTKEHTHYEVMHILQKVGVAAGPSFNAEEMINDPHIKERGFFSYIDHKEVGRRLIYGTPWKLSETPAEIRAASPLLGEHNRYVFSELLKMSQEEINKLSEEKVIY